jgi:hypothetical protein
MGTKGALPNALGNDAHRRVNVRAVQPPRSMHTYSNRTSYEPSCSQAAAGAGPRTCDHFIPASSAKADATSGWASTPTTLHTHRCGAICLNDSSVGIEGAGGQGYPARCSVALLLRIALGQRPSPVGVHEVVINPEPAMVGGV